MKRFYTILTILFTFLTSAAIAQTGTIRGFVYDQESGEPIIFTNVILEGTTYGASTDVNGYYSITKVPPGTYNIQCTYLGYETAKEQVVLAKNKIVTKKLFLKKSAVDLNIVEISAEAQEARTEVKMSVTKVTPKDIQSIPTVGGEADLAQYLQVLPGVVFTGDQGGQLYIRGGSPVQNRVMLDGMTIYNPFHSIGLFSVFETDIIRNADIYTGGFNSDYGGAISSIMDITTKDGNKNRLAGKVGMSTFGAKAILEGPLKRPTEIGGSSISYILSAKTSYLDKTDDIFYTNIENEEGLPYSFTDLYGKISFNGKSGSKVNVFGFNFQDDVDYSVSKLDWKSNGGGVNFVLVPQGSPLLIEANFAVSNYEINQVEVDRNRFSKVGGFNGGLDFTYFNADDEINYGLQVNGFQTDFRYININNRTIAQKESTTEMNGYFKYKIARDRIVIDPGVRVNYYASLSETSFEPRLGIKYNAAEKLRFKAAGGYYTQNLISANSDRDVVNLFNGYLSGPSNLQDNFVKRDGSEVNVDSKLQKSWHAILGFEYDIAKGLSMNVEGYYKYFPQLTTLNRYKLFDDTQENANHPDILTKEFIVEEGEAYGVDIVLKYEYKNFYIFGVYSTSYVDRWDGQQTYNPTFDRRHNMNFVGSYIFGEDLNWEFNVRWNFGTGFPFTQTLGNYENFNFADGIGTDYTTSNGEWGTQYADINEGRLPSYHRLDLNLKRKFAISTNSILEANLGVTNTYNRENIFYYDRIRNERVNQLPIMPSIGVSMTF